MCRYGHCPSKLGSGLQSAVPGNWCYDGRRGAAPKHTKRSWHTPGGHRVKNCQLQTVCYFFGTNAGKPRQRGNLTGKFVIHRGVANR
ncbi:hypothetical protein AAFF_G00034690 [Aldrovandia affinis]|uniref:Uncharacterized protein n=1 Tax=Aldrovandia affinis TaxID=143900 RepID=A0AAD7S3F0_9TELE|nr:hypothetical protein AAFF_G00034690 [Aldrovandia affinis]